MATTPMGMSATPLIWTEPFHTPEWEKAYQQMFQKTGPVLRVSQHWRATKDGDNLCRRLLEAHYSYNPRVDPNGDVPKLFVGPGEKLVLRSRERSTCDAVFVWRRFIDDSGQEGVNCAAFRNESIVRSSLLILDAEHWARDRWGAIRAYTFVDPAAIQSANPGYCYKAAGWKSCGYTKRNNLLILEKQL